VPWQPQRATGRAATTWAASDAVRAAGADGLIYSARSMPTRWHVVLFRWADGRVAVSAGVPAKPLDECVCP
jgi:hypothetical protein